MLPEYSAPTVIHANNRLSSCLKQAVENNLIAENITGKAQKPSPATKEIEIFTPDEVAALLKDAESQPNGVIISLATPPGCTYRNRWHCAAKLWTAKKGPYQYGNPSTPAHQKAYTSPNPKQKHLILIPI